MPIRIIKKAPAPLPAPVVEPPKPSAPPVATGGLRIPVKKAVVPPTKPASKEYPPETDEERLARWKAFPKADEKLKQCEHCEQWYIRPCDAAKAQVCGNGIAYRQKQEQAA